MLCYIEVCALMRIEAIVERFRLRLVVHPQVPTHGHLQMVSTEVENQIVSLKYYLETRLHHIN